jgi:LPXTG-site transpeptidase (sortase) family protein
LKASSKPRWPLTKLTIADIGLETFVVQGMDDAALRRGPGHDVNSSLPGEGNCVIAGHRNVYGSFFYRLDELLPGAPIVLQSSNGKFTYIVEAVFVTPDTNLTILTSRRWHRAASDPDYLHPPAHQQSHHFTSETERRVKAKSHKK